MFWYLAKSCRWSILLLSWNKYNSHYEWFNICLDGVSAYGVSAYGPPSPVYAYAAPASSAISAGQLSTIYKFLISVWGGRGGSVGDSPFYKYNA